MQPRSKQDCCNEAIHMQIRRVFCGIDNYLDRLNTPYATSFISPAVARLDTFCDLLVLVDSYPKAMTRAWLHVIENYLIGECIYRELANKQKELELL